METKAKTSGRENKAHTENPFYNYVLLFFTCACLGWIWEVILTLLQTGILANRGVLHGPWLPIYGCGALIIVLLFDRFRSQPLVVFLLSALTCGLIEYGTGWYLEVFRHHKWWDYGDLWLNLNGRVCLLSITAFGCCGLAVIYFLYPLLCKIANRIKFRPKKILCWCLLLLFLADFIYSSDVPNTGEGITTQIRQVFE